jgi:hypothetical protein
MINFSPYRETLRLAKEVVGASSEVSQLPHHYVCVEDADVQLRPVSLNIFLDVGKLNA